MEKKTIAKRKLEDIIDVKKYMVQKDYMKRN